MLRPPSLDRRRVPPSLSPVTVVVALALVGGCNTSVVSSSTPPATPVATLAATASARPSGSPTAAPPETGSAPAATNGPNASDVTQTDTEWGRIWDAVPRSFPLYPGSEESTDTGAPASAQFVVPTDVQHATAWLKSALDTAGLRTTVSGPLEDGSMQLDSVGPSGCMVSTTIAPTGNVTLMTVLYGALCPFS
jgi:hypothetical protein